jgi:Zn-dependent protease with chaperone function
VTEPVRLDTLHPFEYEHPFDAKSLDALQKTPGLDTLLREYNKHAVERMITIQYTGSNIRITNETHPAIHRLLDQACEILNLPDRPALYVEREDAINGFTIGVDHPIIVVTSSTLDLLEEKELLYLIGHEIGHIKSRHTLYHQMAEFLPVIAEVIGQATLGIGTLLSAPLRLALMHWYRMSEFTADRAGLLACQDVDAAIRVMMKWSGMPEKFYETMQTEAFIQQARDFDQLDYDHLNKLVKVIALMDQTHPWSVMRAAELLRWIEGGEYQQVVGRQTRGRIYKRYDGETAYCRNCKFRLPEATARFCPSCGTPLEPEAS